MNASFSDYGIAVLMIAVAAALVAWFRYKLGRASLSRMYRMMARLGVYPARMQQCAETAAFDLNAVRTRCRRCPAEDVCERWLAGEIEGDNGFCPNAHVFDGVLKTG